MSQDVVGRAVEDRADSPQVFAMLQRWYHDCMENHPDCRPNMSDPETRGDMENVRLPAKLIHIKPDGTLNLYITNHKPGRYVALSYCWGTTKSFKTTRENLEARKRGFSKVDLPQTLQDAITLTWRLGFDLIWIDALCIVQDDGNDWQHQCADIGNIYNNASLTIAASAAKDKADGFLVARQKSRSAALVLPMQCSNSRRHGAVFVYLRPTTRGEVHEVIDRSVLNTRCWCLQERILSRRIVHFSENQIFWECQKCTFAEDGSVFDRTNMLKRELFFGADRNSRAPNIRSLFRGWQKVVRDYSSRKLFDGGDILPALSGMASQVYQLTGSDYLVGVWRLDLPYGLLWYVQEGSRAKSFSGYRGPSWSWVSIDGPVNDSLRADALVMKSRANEVKVIDAVAVVPGADPFGKVNASHVKLRGLMKHARRATNGSFDPSRKWIYVSESFPILDQDGWSIGETNFDDRLDNAPTTFDGLLIAEGLSRWELQEPLGLQPEALWRSTFLALEPASVASTYRRIVAGVIRGRSFSKDSVTTELTTI